MFHLLHIGTAVISGPSWHAASISLRTGAACVSAAANNTRLAMYALPSTPKPAAGYPFILQFSAMDRAFNASVSPLETCGPSPTPSPAEKVCGAFLNATCGAPPDTKHAFAACFACMASIASSNLTAHNCSKEAKNDYCFSSPHGKSAFDKSAVFAGPIATMDGCINATSGHFNVNTTNAGDRGTCGFDQLAGEMWFSRSKQLMVEAGVAIIILNPIRDDEWDWDRQDTRHADIPFLQRLFDSIRDGSFAGLGPAYLDLHNIVPTGYSAGAQVASWLIELTMEKNPVMADTTIAATVMLSGGSHMCYATPPLAVSQCAGCTTTSSHGGGVGGGCSNDVVAAGDIPQCEWCCPANYTESWFVTHPEDYVKHPPAFLAQMSTVDKNADLCATRNYHDTLVAHGVKSQLVLTPPADETCFCIGNPADPAAAQSPLLNGCASFVPYANATAHKSSPLFTCEPHTTGFAAMVEPLASFVVRAVGANASRWD